MSEQKLITAEEYKAAVEAAKWMADNMSSLNVVYKRMARVLLALAGAWSEVGADGWCERDAIAARNGLPVDGGGEMSLNITLSEVRGERYRQDAKWGEQNHPPTEWLAILGEEYGEVCRAVCEAQIKSPHMKNQGDWKPYRTELIQLAAVAVAMVECLDRNNKPCQECGGKRRFYDPIAGWYNCPACQEEHEPDRACQGKGR